MLCYLPDRPDQVLTALREGKITFLDVATEEVPDLFLHYAIDSGLLEGLAKSFPDPREQPEIGMDILLAAGIAGHFAGLYALSQLPYALHWPKLLTLLGVQVVVQQPGKGLSRKGTQEDTSFHGDVMRKLLQQIALADEKQKRLPGQSLIDWYNAHVGKLCCRAAKAKPCIHILDCTDLTVPLKNENYARSGVTTKNNKPERGYKLATLRSLLDDGAVMTAMAWDQIQEHDLVLTYDLVRKTPHLRPGDTLLEDRGFIDAPTISLLKKQPKVDICTGLKREMLLFRGAIAQANAHPGAWRAHPIRKGQEIQPVEGVRSLWQGLDVDINVCVVRFTDKQTGDWDYMCFATTDLSLSAQQIIEFYQLRTEIEADYRQLKSPSWRIAAFLTTRLVQILWHVLLTLIAYNLFQVHANTEAGRAFAGKTKQRIERERRRNPQVQFLVCTAHAFALFEARELFSLMLLLPQDARETLSALLQTQNE